jgi:hypothetical protein
MDFERGGLWISRWVVVEILNSDGKARVEWRMKPEFVLNRVQDQENEGVYVPRTNLAQESPEDVWKGYMTLTRVEATFRSLKQELRLRPVFYQKGDRVETHILLSYIAYAFPINRDPTCSYLLSILVTNSALERPFLNSSIWKSAEVGLRHDTMSACLTEVGVRV